MTLLLSKSFLKSALLANLIAWPAAWFAMDRWLQGFAYRAELDPWLFAIPSFTAIVIALATVSIQGIKAAVADPIDALQYE